MIFKRLLMTFVLPMALLMSLPARAQDKIVAGKVTDSKDGQPLGGASVLVKGTKIGMQTNNDGTFRLTAPADAVALSVSIVGYSPQEVAIGSGPLSISLTQITGTLNDVVVIGYGTVKKKDLTGSITTISEKDFQKGAITTPEEMIAGKVAGVSVISNGGSPGAGSTIRIRGGSSLTASNDPLIVIDGVALEGGSISGVANPLSMINSDDIESFSVLKDAAATAIYGSRAANGVIIITTKKGKSGGLKETFSTVNSLSVIQKEINVLNGPEIRSVVQANGSPAQIAMLGTANTNWQNQIFQKAFGTTNNLSLSGGIKNFPYRLSIGYQDQDGILKTDNLQKTSVSLALNPTFFHNSLKIDINIKGSLENTRFANTGAIGGAIGFDPTQPVYASNKTKRYNGYFEWVDGNGNLLANIPYNPLGELYDQVNKSNPERSIGSLQVDYSLPFLPELHAKVNTGYDIAKGAGSTFVNDSAAMNYFDTGYYNQYKNTVQNTYLEYYLNYAKDLKSINSKIDAIAGYSYNNYLTTTYNYATYNAIGYQIPGSTPTFPTSQAQHNLQSFFARAAYIYKDKYYLTGGVRDDGSSRFGPYGTGTTIGTIGNGNRWGLFPEVAFKWKLNNEGFLKNNRTISDLDVRLSYGVTGQQDGSAIGNYSYLSVYSLATPTAAYQFGPNYIQGYRPSGFDANLKWEQTATYNAAVDYGFLNNRINGSVDFYLKKTSNLLVQIPEPAGTNFSAFQITNVGNMENKGVEFNINAVAVRTKDFEWSVNFNITYNKNTITNLSPVPGDTANSSFPSGAISGNGAQGFAFINAVGYSKNTFDLQQQVYDANGKPVEGLFNDINRDGQITSADYRANKHSDPDVFLGFSSNFSYKKWDLGFVLRGSFGNYVYNQNNATGATLANMLGGTVISNAEINYLATGFKGTTHEFLSDYYLENGSFLKMDNASIGYNFGRVFRNSRAVLRASLIVQNVFTITKYTGIDPEVSGGIDSNQYPRPRIYSAGINLNL